VGKAAVTATPEIVLERHPFELRVLTQIAKTLTSRLPLADLLHLAMERLNASLGPADVGILYLWDESSGVFRASASFGCEAAALGEVALEAGESIAGKVFAEGHARLYSSPDVVAEAMADLRDGNRQALLRALGTAYLPRSVLAAPLRVADDRLGVLLLYTLHGALTFTEADLPFIQTLADLLALAIDRGRLEENDEVVREVRRSERLRSEIMATLSHELRTPLAAIRGYATALMMEEIKWPKWKRDQFLRLIDDECDNLQAMIGEILDSSLIDIGQLAIVPQPLRLPHLLSEVAAEMQRRTRVHRLVVDTPPDFPILDADPHRIKQVLRNLLDNAIKYSPTGGLVVLRAEVSEAEVTVSVSDQGVGISPQDMIPLFDKYFRAKSPAGYHVAGTGLGLPVARTIVETHGGRIWAQSKVGQGTTLFFTLPRTGLSSGAYE
jgi:signal transduction histidine kinase